MFQILLSLHILGATVWVGGHLVLLFTYLPQALKQKNVSLIQDFEGRFEKIGIPALLIQVISGLALAYKVVPDLQLWFDFENPISRAIFIKLLFLAITLGLALDARLRIIPKLSPDRLVSLAFHIIPVTLIGVLFALVGVAFRFGGL